MRTLPALAILAFAVPAAAAPKAKKPLPPATAATQGLIIELADGRRPIADVIDRSAGVVYLDDFEGPAEEHWKPTHTLLCGRALDKRMKQLIGELKERAHQDHDEGHLACSNRGTPMCFYGGSMEWDPVTRLHFRKAADGTVKLAAITVLDEVLVGEDDVSAQARKQDKLVAKLSAKTCPAQ